jgi:uncharacterized protein YndB with AHSA1/START domain
MVVSVVIVLIVVVVLALAATKPQEFSIERHALINAGPERVFAFIVDFHEWPKWAPQDRDDKSMRRTFSGATSGLGAVCEWQGDKSGKGRMSVVECDAPRHLIIDVAFEKPFVANNRNEFSLTSDPGGCRIVWTMRGTNLFIMRVMGVFMNLDRLMGRHFERGLAGLKDLAEAS